MLFRLGPSGRFALANALQRMDDTWLIGDRGARVSLSQDGRALLQIDQKETSGLSIYLIDQDGKPARTPVAQIPLSDLSDRRSKLAVAYVGPPTDGNGQIRLAVLTFRRPGQGFTVAAYKIPQPRPEPDLVQDLPSTHDISPVEFSPDGRHAVFIAIEYPKPDPKGVISGNPKGKIYGLTHDAHGSVSWETFKGERGGTLQEGPNSAVAFGQSVGLEGLDRKSVV